jgi:hypothetical protein
MEAMMDLQRAIAYVQERGDAIERARLTAILSDERPSEAALQALAALQQADGSFAYWVPQAGNVCDTAYVLQWFDDLRVYRGPIVDPACRFLLDCQLADCGWDEVDAVRAWTPPEWMTPGRIETRVWLTAFCAHVLIRFGCAEAEGSGCPTDFLLAHCDATGRLEGYLRATWLALPMFAFYPGPDSEAFHRAVEVTEANYSADWQGPYLAWLLRCLQDAGLPAEHSLVTRSLDDLERKQRPDGSWEPEEGEGENLASNATVAALRVLKGYARI